MPARVCVCVCKCVNCILHCGFFLAFTGNHQIYLVGYVLFFHAAVYIYIYIQNGVELRC